MTGPAPSFGRQRLSLAIAAALTVPGIVVRFTGAHFAHPVEALLFGLAIVGAAFMLSWAAEVAQLDISAGLAIAVLAFIAVLPEYAVDLVFAWKGGDAVERFGPACGPPGAEGETPCALALANMTGANRLLIGLGWSMVVFIAWYQWRKRQMPDREIKLERSHSVELSFLTVASLYSLSLPLKRSITLIDTAVLVTLFIAYTVRISKAPAEEPHLVGPAAWIGTFADTRRRLSVLGLFSFAAFVVLLCAEPFAEALVETGAEFGISEFFLVQWLAPLASEAPELLIAGLYAWRLKTSNGLGALVSSKVNQWTLLVGSLPLVFAIASGSLHGLPIIARQRDELLLTAAQSVFAVAVLANLSISVKEAFWLFGLFWAQFILGAIVPESAHGVELVAVSVLYLVLAAAIIVRQRKAVKPLLEDGFRTSYAELARSD
ncbi:MAG: sodium:proton exchanger [Acidimicrobiales bacterium]